MDFPYLKVKTDASLFIVKRMSLYPELEKICFSMHKIYVFLYMAFAAYCFYCF